jgi:hypothetical protein
MNKNVLTTGSVSGLDEALTHHYANQNFEVGALFILAML